jgi:hypothetical protein
LTFVLLAATASPLAIVWDEGYTLGRLDRMRLWARALADPSRFAATAQASALELVNDDLRPPRFPDLDRRSMLFEPRVMAWFWPFARQEPNGHPPFYALVAWLGDVVAPWLDELPRARVGPMLAFSLATGSVFAFMARRWGAWPAAAGAGALLLQPRLLAHAHYALYDALLTALWVGSILAFASAVEPRDGEKRPGNPRWGWAVVLGLLAGWAADTKFTGWFLPVPFIAWSILYRSRRGALALLVGGLVGVVALYAFNPPWWGDPIGGVRRFFESSLTRGQTVPITVRFLGSTYKTPRESLPPYNTLIWTLFITPLGFLALALAGARRSIRRWRAEPFGVLAVLHWAFLLGLRALPHTPGHDAERLFLPAFGVLALLAAVGAAGWHGRLARWGIAAAIGEGAVSIALMMPVPLAYYSPLIGGPPGAARLGMEPTYYWDALTDDALAWLNKNTPPGGSVAFAAYPTSWFYLLRSHRLTTGLTTRDRGNYAWYVLQNRPGDFSTTDVGLVLAGRPAYEYRKGGVPLLWIYPYAQVVACEQAQRSQGRTVP